jgi:hypothetical protein
MKREFLKGLDLGNGARLPDEAVEAIMAEYGRTKAQLESTITSLTQERDGLSAQLSEASTTIQSYQDMDIGLVVFDFLFKADRKLDCCDTRLQQSSL